VGHLIPAGTGTRAFLHNKVTPVGSAIESAEAAMA
jgi:hypothetical protein